MSLGLNELIFVKNLQVEQYLAHGKCYVSIGWIFKSGKEVACVIGWWGKEDKKLPNFC